MLILKAIVLILAAAVIVITLFMVKARAAGNAQYRKYEQYTMQTLNAAFPLRQFAVKPEYQKIHPAKMLKLFKILVHSYEGERLARVNSLDATMLLFMKMYTLMIRPDYNYNLPMLSVDFIFIGKKRVFVIEVIDPAKIADENKRIHFDKMKIWQDTLATYEQSPTKEWYKDFLTDFSIHIKAGHSKDEELFKIYQTFLESYIAMAQHAQKLTPDQSAQVKKGMEFYVATLLAQGGPAVDVFKKFLGPEKQQEYVRTVMFGLDA